jgi:two-component system chemotaxis sensor kinase CheA
VNEFLEQFLIESRELVEQATADLLALEENPGDTERLDGAFRAFHTLKGSAGIVDFAAMATAAHAAEDRLADIRSGKTRLSRALISDALSCLDLVVRWLDAMQVNGEIPAGADESAQAMVRLLGQDVAPAAPGTPTGLSDNAMALLRAQRDLLLEQGSQVGTLLSAGRVILNVLRSVGRSQDIPETERLVGEAGAAEDARPLISAIERLLGQFQGMPVPASRVQDTAARVLRVDVERVDALVKLTGELTVAKNAIGYAAQLAAAGADPAALEKLLKEQYGQICRLVEELQRSVLGIRVLPMRQVFNRFPRLVREIAESLGKPARLVMEGDSTEADKIVVENLFEPLLHIVRNALDHGVETPAERAASGKPPIATITLRASRAGDAVLVEVEDDGRGIDIAKVRQLAVAREVVKPEELAAMSDAEAIDLVFAPGFSTADTVTDLSGRGVGMDVVRRNVERLGGSAHLDSQPGAGTRAILKLPFSVMMTRVMTVQVGGQTFGLALESILETVRVPRSAITAIGAGHAFVLRDRTIPLVDLKQALGKAQTVEMPAHANIVVVSIGGQLGSVEVDQFGDRLDVMLKPMDGLLEGMPGMAGTSLMGDGGVLIVLDLPDLLH